MLELGQEPLFWLLAQKQWLDELYLLVELKVMRVPERNCLLRYRCYFPDEMPRETYYRPVERGFEREIVKRLAYWESLRRRKQSDEDK